LTTNLTTICSETTGRAWTQVEPKVLVTGPTWILVDAVRSGSRGLLIRGFIPERAGPGQDVAGVFLAGWKVVVLREAARCRADGVKVERPERSEDERP